VAEAMEQLHSRGDAGMMETRSRSRPVHAARPSLRPRLAARATALGIVLSSATVILSALNLISIQQTIAMALAAALTTLGGLIVWIVPDAWVAWRRGFRRGCEAAATSHSYRPSADLTANALWDVRLASVMSCPRAQDCGVRTRGVG
jgi:hypothetical protein